MADVDPPDESVSFERDIVGLFRPMDIQCMRGYVPPAGTTPDIPTPVLLADYEYMKVPANAKMVLAYLTGKKITAEGEEVVPRMPYGGPYWNEDALDLFRDWIAGGLLP